MAIPLLKFCLGGFALAVANITIVASTEAFPHLSTASIIELGDPSHELRRCFLRVEKVSRLKMNSD